MQNRFFNISDSTKLKAKLDMVLGLFKLGVGYSLKVKENKRGLIKANIPGYGAAPLCVRRLASLVQVSFVAASLSQELHTERWLSQESKLKH